MLQSNKATQNTDISTKLIEDKADIFAEFVFTSLNKCIEQSIFPWNLKLANITPAHKKAQKAQLQKDNYRKDKKTQKDNYRPASVLLNISKVYENFIFEQMQGRI